MLAEMGVAIHTDGHTVGLFQPRRVSNLMTVIGCTWSVYVEYLKVIFLKSYSNYTMFFFKVKVGIPNSKGVSF